ncbi:MAG: 50S ribosomal protein L25 [Tissierellia bacterium]|nr:50S ribosomal protein L25 [Tissierellia bacterium]
MADIKLQAQVREGKGKNKVDKLRAEQNIPGVIYGKGEENLAIQMIEKELHKAFLSAGSSVILDIVLDGKTIPVLFKEVQKHPYKNQYTHVDFYKINMKESLRLMVPVVLEGRDEIRLQPSVLTQHLNEVEVECLPSDIPQAAVFNVQEMQYGDTIYVKDLDIFADEKLTIHTDAEELVAALSEPREEAVEEDVSDEEMGEVPTVGETTTEDEE